MIVAGQSFATWQDYLKSALFHAQGLRCGTRFPGTRSGTQPASDCSLDSTTIRGRYEPAGHVLFRIPVVVHILQSTGGQGQISDAQVQSQIDVLNEDYGAIPGTPGELGTSARIEFFLATVDPNGNSSTGIMRSTDDAWFDDTGDYFDVLAWDTRHYLNLYTNRASGTLGYVPDLPQGGIAGTPAKSYSPNRARRILVKTLASRVPPRSRISRRAAARAGSAVGTPATFIAK